MWKNRYYSINCMYSQVCTRDLPTSWAYPSFCDMRWLLLLSLGWCYCASVLQLQLQLTSPPKILSNFDKFPHTHSYFWGRGGEENQNAPWMCKNNDDNETLAILICNPVPFDKDSQKSNHKSRIKIWNKNRLVNATNIV